MVAHEIGYGKTVVTLALIDHRSAADKSTSVEERQSEVDALWREELPLPFAGLGARSPVEEVTTGGYFVHLTATLIAVPAHITGQWASEAVKFLGLGRREVLVFKKLTELTGTSLDALKAAELIIISSDVFNEPAYRRQLITLACWDELDGPADVVGLVGRELDALYQDVVRHSRLTTGYYLTRRSQGAGEAQAVAEVNTVLLPFLRGQVRARNAAPERQSQAAPEGRKQPRLPQAPDVAASRTTTVAEGGKDPKHRKPAGMAPAARNRAELEAAWGTTWIHNLSFARFIWDEFSYENAKLGCFAETVSASAKWFLSGTPRLATLRDVCATAKKFGIHLARPEPQMMPGLPESAGGPVLGRTSKSEDFRAFSAPLRSIDMAAQRYGQGEVFVRAFCRANTLHAAGIRAEETVLMVSMLPGMAMQYHLASNEVLAASRDFNALPASTRGLVRIEGEDIRQQEKGGSSLAGSLQVLVACGVVSKVCTVKRVQSRLLAQITTSERLYKLLCDKAVFLACFLAVFARKNPKLLKSVPNFTDTINRAKLWCLQLGVAWRSNNFEQSGSRAGFLRTAHVLTGSHTVAAPETQFYDLRNLLGRLERLAKNDFTEKRERQDWRTYNALFSWLDFYDMDDATLKSLTPVQLQELALDLFPLEFRVPVSDEEEDTDARRRSILSRAGQNTRRLPTERIESLIAATHNQLNASVGSQVELKAYIKKWTNSKPGKPTMSADDKGDYAGMSKADLQAKLAQRNVAFKSGDSNVTLKERLWQYRNGLLEAAGYRDGRAAINLHDKFPAIGKAANKDFVDTAADLKATIIQLNKVEQELPTARREESFAKHFLELGKDGFDNRECDGCRNTLISKGTSFLVVPCGHVICLECNSAMFEHCVVTHCGLFTLERPVLRCSEIGAHSDGNYTRPQQVTNLIQNVILPDDRVVVFVQYRQMMNAIQSEFMMRNVEFTDLEGPDPSKELGKFQRDDGKRVLLLDIDSDASAGSNLTMANHVIFATPYMHPDPAHRDMVIRQAKGRCVRTGQKKKVRIWHFVSRNTIEEAAVRERLPTNPGLATAFEPHQDRLPWWLDDGTTYTPRLSLPEPVDARNYPDWPFKNPTEEDLDEY